MNYMGASINTTSVLNEQAGQVISNGAFHLVKYGDNGHVVMCSTEGELAAGVLLPETTKETEIGEDVTIQIKDIGLCLSGAEVKKGSELMTDTQGRCIPATSGNFVVGYAVTSAAKAGEIIEIDIRKCGYKA